MVYAMLSVPTISRQVSIKAIDDLGRAYLGIQRVHNLAYFFECLDPSAVRVLSR
jgi:hypothetical protein